MKGFKKISPAIFGIVIICFFLPFVDVSCGNQKIATITGIQFVTGAEIGESELLEGKRAQKVESEPIVIAVLICTIAGLLLSFIRNGRSSILPAISALAALILLLIFKAKLDNEVLKQGEGVLRLEYRNGFWGSLLSLILAAVLNGFMFLQGRNSVKDKSG